MTPPAPSDGDHVVNRIADRSNARRQQAYVEEIRCITDATLKIIAKTGSTSPRIREIVAKAGISSQTFYRHFRTKDELFLVLVDDARTRFRAHFEDRMSTPDLAAGKILAWVAAVLEIATDKKAVERYYPFLACIDGLQGDLRRDLQRSEDLMIEQLTAAIEVAVEQGECRSAAPLEDATGIYRLAFGAMHDAIRAQRTPSAEEHAHLADMVCRLLAIDQEERARAAS